MNLMMKRKRDLQPWSMHYLPDDLLPEILSKLPVQSLLQFRTVSKTWWALIDDPDFARLHLTRFKNNRHETHLFTPERTSPYIPYEFLVRCSKTLRIVPRFHFPVLDNARNWMVIDSNDGLVMLKEQNIKTNEWLPQDSLLLWNPSIRKSRILPPSPQILPGRRTFDLGLGFDMSIKDYKYVRFVGAKDTYPTIDSVVVYTVGTNSWKTVELRGKGCAHYGWYYVQAPMNHIYLKGVMYLMASNSNSVSLFLASYDLSTEVIASTNLPKDQHLTPRLIHRRALTLADGGCSLGVVSLWGECGTLWVLENFGADIESMTWAKRYNFSPGLYGDFLYLKKNGDMILNKWKSVTCYNSETHEERTLLNWESIDYAIAIHAWTESLILLK